jgi:hypothetical protein
MLRPGQPAHHSSDWKTAGWTFSAEATFAADPADGAGDGFGHRAHGYRDWNAWVCSGGDGLWKKTARTHLPRPNRLRPCSSCKHHPSTAPADGAQLTGSAASSAFTNGLRLGLDRRRQHLDYQKTVSSSFRWSVAPTRKPRGEPPLSGGGQGWYLTSAEPGRPGS